MYLQNRKNAEIIVKETERPLSGLLLFLKLFHLKDRFTEKEPKAEISPIHLFTPEMAAMATAECIQSQEPRASFRCPMWHRAPRT